MRLLGKYILLKAIKKEELGIEEIDYYEVAEIGDKVEIKLKKGDKIFYQQGIARVNILDQEYQLVDEDQLVAIL